MTGRKSLSHVTRHLSLFSTVLALACGQQLPEPDPTGTSAGGDPKQPVHIEIVGSGEVAFQGRLEADMAQVFGGGEARPYVACRQDPKSLAITIAQSTPGVPYLDVLTISGINATIPGTTGTYTTNAFTGRGTKNNEVANVSADVSEPAIHYLAGKVSTDFMASPAECTISVEARTGNFSCNYQDGVRILETVSGTWSCYGFVQ